MTDLFTLAIARSTGGGGGGGGEVTRAEFEALVAIIPWKQIFEPTNEVGTAEVGTAIVG